MRDRAPIARRVGVTRATALKYYLYPRPAITCPRQDMCRPAAPSECVCSKRTNPVAGRAWNDNVSHDPVRGVRTIRTVLTSTVPTAPRTITRPTAVLCAHVVTWIMVG